MNCASANKVGKRNSNGLERIAASRVVMDHFLLVMWFIFDCLIIEGVFPNRRVSDGGFEGGTSSNKLTDP